jgi:hypothetical protein
VILLIIILIDYVTYRRGERIRKPTEKQKAELEETQAKKKAKAGKKGKPVKGGRK